MKSQQSDRYEQGSTDPFSLTGSLWRYVYASPMISISCSVIALSILYCFDQFFQEGAWWLFIFLALTVGFIHGSLDVLLLGREFTNTRHRLIAGGLYLGLVLVLGSLLSLSWQFALLALIVMSAWHFGEPYGRWAQADLLSRVAVGGASVMLPMLVSGQAMLDLLNLLAPGDATELWRAWRTIAFIWLALVPLCAVLLARQHFRKTLPLTLELIATLMLNLLFSPLMAFALYFGCYHSIEHVARVARQQKLGIRALMFQPIVIASLVTTIGLLVLLGWYLRNLEATAAFDYPFVLRWLVVALAAVTLPHLILVSRCANWLRGAQMK